MPVTTLDALIAEHGVPAFIKIDVEGFEAEALAGLTQAVAALSFEFTTIQREVALECIERCGALGFDRFNAALGESQTLVHGEWRGREDIARWLIELPHCGQFRGRLCRPGLSTRRRRARPRMIAVLVLCAFGFGLTLYVFYPGVMTFDARYVYGYIVQRDELVDWQSPLMTLLWAVIDPIAPGSGSMFLLDASLYWLAFTLLALTVARRSWFALALPLLAISPPAFVLVGIIWRDVLFAVVWLLAAALVFVAQDRSASARYLIQGLALVLLAFGVLLRPNALTAAPILAAFILWPARFKLKRTLAIYRARAGVILCAGAGGLLRHHRRQEGSSAALDHRVRSRRHHAFFQAEPVSGFLDTGRDGDAHRAMLQSARMEFLLEYGAMPVRHAPSRGR